MNVRKFHFDIVHGCNLRCVGCPNSTLDREVWPISVEDFALCLSHVDVERVGLLRLFNYGEPLLHPDLPGILAVIPKQEWSAGGVEVSTNGQCHRFGMLGEALKTGVLDTLVVSCDGDGTPGDYERLRPPARWDWLVEFLFRARELRDRYAPGVRLLTKTICESDEGHHRWERMLGDIGGWRPVFRGWLPLPGAKRAHGAGMGDGACVYVKGKNLYVDADGTVVPCCAHPRAFELDDLKEQLYSRIRRGERWRAMFRQMETDRAAMPVCGECGI